MTSKVARANKSKTAKGKTPAKRSTKKSGGNVRATKPAQTKKPAKKQEPKNPQPVAEVISADAKPVVIIPPVVPGCVPFGKHRGKAWADVPKSYLDWMINSGHTNVAEARAELAKRDAPPKINIRIAPAAIDEASMKLNDHFDRTRGTFEGLYSWLVKLATEALNASALFDRAGGDVDQLMTEHNGIKFEFSRYFDEREHPTRRAGYQLDIIRNPKAGIRWSPPVRAGMDRADYADRARVKGRGVW